MKKVKKLVSMLLVCIMVGAIFTGCGKKGDEVIQLTCYSQLANYSGKMTGWFAKILKDKWNVEITIIPETGGIYDARMESGDLGDLVVWGSDGNDYKNAIRAGLLLDWNEGDLLTEYGPTIKAGMPFALEKNANLLNNDLTETDDAGNLKYPNASDYVGKTFGFGHNVAISSDAHEAFFYTWDLRWDLYQQLGCPTVKNLDDLIQLFRDMKEICPTDENGQETYAVSLWPDWDGNMVMYVKAFVTAYYGLDEMGLGNYDSDTGEFHDCLDPDGYYVESMRFFNRLYQEGLLDPDSMTQTYAEMGEKVAAGGTFWSIFNYAGCAAYNTPEHMEAGKMMYTVVPEEATPIAYGMNVAGGNRVWTIGAKTKHPEVCMQILDWICTPEGRLTMDYGPKDIMWYYDEAGYTCFTELGKACWKDRTIILDPETAGGYSGEFNGGAFQINNTTWSASCVNPDSVVGEKFEASTWKSNSEAAQYEIEQQWRDYFGVNSPEEYLESRPYKVAYATTYAEGDQDTDLKLVWNQVTDCIVSGTWNCLYAKTDEEFDTLLQKMIDDANAYGYEQCIEWCLNEAAIRNALEEPLRK